MAKTITLTQTDYDRLKALTSVDPDPSDLDKNAFQELRAELDRAVVVDPKEIDPNVVTVNSRSLSRTSRRARKRNGARSFSAGG